MFILHVSFCQYSNFRIQVSDDENDYSYDVEDFLLRIIFHNLYNFGSIVSYCQPYVDCTDDCTKCPENHYEEFAQKVHFEHYTIIA